MNISDLLGISVVYALSVTIADPGGKTLSQIIAGYIGVFLGILGAVAMGFIIYGGVLFAISAGDPEKVTKARSTLTWAVVGILVIASSFAIVVYLNKLFF